MLTVGDRVTVACAWRYLKFVDLTRSQYQCQSVNGDKAGSGKGGRGGACSLAELRRYAADLKCPASDGATAFARWQRVAEGEERSKQNVP